MRSQSGCRWQLLSAQPPFMAFNALSAIHLPISDHIPVIPNKRKARTLIGRAQSAFTIRRTDHSSWRVRRSLTTNERTEMLPGTVTPHSLFFFFFFFLFSFFFFFVIQYLSQLLLYMEQRYVCPNNYVREYEICNQSHQSCATREPTCDSRVGCS